MNRQWPTIIGVLAIVALMSAIAIGCAETQSGQASAEPAETTSDEAAQEGEVPPAEIIKVTSETFDAVVLRPLTLLQVAAGFALFLPAAALSASLAYLISPSSSAATAQTNFDDAWDVFVLEPYERAIPRPLGAW